MSVVSAAAAGRKTVLIVAPDFAPSSYPPALRVRFFAQHLPEFGWNPIVLTTEPRFYEWSVDHENERLLNPGLEVVRTPALPVKWTRKLGVGDLGIRSLWHHWRALIRICRQRRVDLIFIPVPPNYSMLLGRLAYARFGIPYVIDYIDPLVTDYYKKLPRSQRPPKYGLANGVARRMEPFALKHVAGIVGVNLSYTADLFTRYGWLKAPASGIPYGAEPGDFEYLRQNPRTNSIFDKHDGLLHLSYVGRGGPDIVPVLRALFQAVRSGLQSAPELFDRLRLHFVGTTYASGSAIREQVMPVAREIGVEGLVDEHAGRVPYLTAMQILLDSHALLVLGSDSAHYTASKIFPYILTARPLLAIFHERSSVVEILRQTGAGEAITFTDSGQLPGLTATIQTHLAQIASSREQVSRQVSTRFAPYTARAMTARLADAFATALAAKAAHCLTQNFEQRYGSGVDSMVYECPSCSQKNTRLLGQVAGHNAFICKACELAFMEPGACEVYQHEEWYEWLEFTPQVGRRYLDSAASVYGKQLQVLEKLVSGRNLVDVGAGLGIFAKIATEKGWTVSCVELNPRARAFGTQFYGLDYQDLEAIAPNSLDVVRLSHVLEHIPRPKPLLASLHKALKPGGVCVVLVPNFEPLSCVIRNAVLKCIPGRHDFRGHIYAPQHALGFRPQSLSETFAKIGFSRVDVQSVSQGNSTYYPWKSDGVALTSRHITYELLNNLGNPFGRGSWVVGYFRTHN